MNTWPYKAKHIHKPMSTKNNEENQSSFEEMESEREAIAQAIEQAVSDKWYSKLREKQLEDDDFIRFTLTVKVNTAEHKVDVDASGSTKLKHTGSSSYDDPSQPKLFNS